MGIARTPVRRAAKRLRRELAALGATLGGSLALVRGRLGPRELDRDIRARYGEPAELATARALTQAGLTPGERRLFAAHLKPGARVLDVGCGCGRVALALARAGCRVVGVDVSEAMVREAHALARAAGLDLRVQVMDARHLGFRPAAFDAVLMLGSVLAYVHGRRTRIETLAGARRVLRPGGTLVVVVPSRHAAWRFRVWFAGMSVLAAVLRRLGAPPAWEPGDRLGPAWSGDRTRPVYWHMYAPGELAADLTAAGLEIVDAFPRAYMMSFVARRPP